MRVTPSCLTLKSFLLSPPWTLPLTTQSLNPSVMLFVSFLSHIYQVLFLNCMYQEPTSLSFYNLTMTQDTLPPEILAKWLRSLLGEWPLPTLVRSIAISTLREGTQDLRASLFMMKPIAAPHCPLNKAFHVYVTSEPKRPSHLLLALSPVKFSHSKPGSKPILLNEYFNFFKRLPSKLWVFTYTALGFSRLNSISLFSS